MAGKSIKVIFFRQNHLRPDWEINTGSTAFDLFFIELAEDLARLGISLSWEQNEGVTIDVNSYADVLNAVRIASPSDGISSICIGHIIGKSPNLDLMEDIRRGVNRVAFAPETVAPEDGNRRVCHNCGCGC